MISLLIFQFIVSMYLKSIAVGSQVSVTAIMFHFNNCIIFLSKMLLFPFTKKMNSKHLYILLFFMLALSGVSYIATILSMIVANALVLKILSNNNKVNKMYNQQFITKIGSLTGVLLVPYILMYSYLYISNLLFVLVSISLLCLGNSLIYDKNNNIAEKKENKDSNLGVFKLAYKYSDVVCAYIFMAVIAYFTSNISFFARSSKYAIAPALASLALVFPFCSYYMFLPVILGLISLYYSSLTIFILTLFLGFINIQTKLHAKIKYQDSYLPHLTASFCVDIIFLIFHFIVGCYYLFYKYNLIV